MIQNLPDKLRPRGVPNKRFVPGLDLPSWFFYDIKAIDRNLYFIYHPHKVMWDNIINQYTGSLEDPRFHIHREHGEEQWGFVLTSGSGAPIPEHSWHLWRLCEPYGWAHVVRIEDHHERYLRLLVRRLHLQAVISDKYGAQAYSRGLAKEQADEREKQQDEQQELFDAVQEENSWLMKRAMENFDRGEVKPTNPQKESIISYPNQKNRSAIVRPLSDTEGGLILPDHLKK